MPGHAGGMHRAKLRQTSGTPADVAFSGQGYAATGDYASTLLYLQSVVTISSSTAYEIQQKTESAVANGLGKAFNSVESELYTQLKITKIK